MQQEGVGLDIDDDKPAPALDTHEMHIAHGCPGLTTSAAKGTEVALTEQALRFQMHDLRVEGVRKMRTQATEVCGTGGMIVNDVAIAPCNGRETGMKIVAHGCRPVDGDAGRQYGIAADHPGLGITRYRGIEMNHLVGAVHASVGTPGADGENRCGCNLAECSFQGLLHGGQLQLALRLPPVKTAAVVFDSQSDALTRSKTRCP